MGDLSLPFKPHTWTLSSRERNQLLGAATTGTQGTTTSVRGIIQPVGSSYAYERFGIEVENGYMAMHDPDDAHSVGDEVSWDGTAYKVVAASRTFKSILSLDHGACILKEMRTEDV
jgi:hypothetical protein